MCAGSDDASVSQGGCGGSKHPREVALHSSRTGGGTHLALNGVATKVLPKAERSRSGAFRLSHWQGLKEMATGSPGI